MCTDVTYIEVTFDRSRKNTVLNILYFRGKKTSNYHMSRTTLKTLYGDMELVFDRVKPLLGF